MKVINQWISNLPVELIFWIGSLAAVLLLDPHGGSHLSLCPLSQLGFEWCPGCGLGRSMSLLARGEFQASWDMHPLALLAYGVISSRIWQLIKNLKTTHNYG
ncbi:DUF2752 domain-containing protein [Algoriphagus sp. C2-6-M1]|uniref:DUF2752 domain-containing protein n=1 Tax=Algoriphagus persicinus TaxID=3108754 RepID=UPI002B39145C|nr:DUF2752 domain-containing protein [Algoriphagus sp. C2-6-M1]MEB2782051.1 DUF2752 domain-containing protein [Algoriphagus sp. C2-6-M1]